MPQHRLKNQPYWGTSQQPVNAKQTAANFLTEEKKDIVADYVRWYVIDRNSSVIDRFKDGFSALQFLTALQRHPSLLTPVLCHSEKRLKPED
ncbi:hypothetical protein D4764_04G0009640 [Takifugu flavidus]|uniref:Uncharacterized protein n=1 Tax=Takifugu flavidus TaxID=433684 RepID=A0A5C6N9L4_9TELE|nr:hypothetical protein D4764_04G0009640 [Takifugu flavidus]